MQLSPVPLQNLDRSKRSLFQRYGYLIERNSWCAVHLDDPMPLERSSFLWVVEKGQLKEQRWNRIHMWWHPVAGIHNTVKNVAKTTNTRTQKITWKPYLKNEFHVRGKLDSHSRKSRIPKIYSRTQRHLLRSIRYWDARFKLSFLLLKKIKSWQWTHIVAHNAPRCLLHQRFQIA